MKSEQYHQLKKNCIQLTRAVAILLVTCFGFTATSHAEDVIKETAAGGVNWTQGVVFAHGYGTAKPGLSSGQRRILSRRAAIVDAQRNLLEMTKGVRISSVLKTDEAMKASREVATRVEGVIKGAQVIKDHYQNDVATVTMAMPISGEFLKVVWPQEQKQTFNLLPAGQRLEWQKSIDRMMVVSSRFIDALSLFPTASASDALVIRSEPEAEAFKTLITWLEGNDATDISAKLQEAVINFETNNQFSGLLIDASGVNSFELATVPNIRDIDGNVVYPTPSTSYDDIVNKRGVTYDFDIQDAVRNQRVATSPFIIRAQSTYKNLASDLVISKEDASRILQSASTRESMSKAGVLIVVAI